MNCNVNYKFFLNNHPPSDGLVDMAKKDIEKSGLSPETLEKAQVRLFNGDSDLLKQRIGFASINGHNLLASCRLIEFPNIGEDGGVVSWCYKLIPPLYDADGKEIKYLHSKGLPATPYVPLETWQAKKATKRA